MRMVMLSTLAAVLLTMAAVHPANAALQKGTWVSSGERGEGVNIFFQWGSTMLGLTFARSELRGLTEPQLVSRTSTPVSFRIEREPGVLEFEGVLREGRGTGSFTYQPNGQFLENLRSLGVQGTGRISDHDRIVLALGRATTAAVREFTGLSLGTLSVSQLAELFIHGVTPEYVRSVRSLGLAGTNTVPGLVELRIHRVTREYVRELEALGYRNLSRADLLQMGLHGVSREQIQGLARVGYRNLTPRQLTDMRMHGATPEFIQEMREVSFRDLSPEALVELRLHRVTARYVRELEALGYRNLTRSQLLQMGIHDVSPDFIRQVRAAGFRDLSPEMLVQMRIHGIRSAQRRGR